jgi:hypothetical protein
VTYMAFRQLVTYVPLFLFKITVDSFIGND